MIKSLAKFKMKNSIRFAIFSITIALCTALRISAQTYVTLVATVGGPASLSIPTNTLATVIHVTPNPTPYNNSSYLSSGYSVNVTVGAAVTTYYPYGFSGTGVTLNNTWPVVVGPASISLTNGGYSCPGTVICTVQLTPINQNVVSNYVPADAIVIPASTSGTAQIILESSPDLVNWTAANPGTYGASAGTNRFFRVRATTTH